MVETVAADPAPPLTPEGQPGQSPTRRASGRPPLPRWFSGISIPFWVSATRIGVGLVFAHLVLVLLPQAHQTLPEKVLNSGTWLGAFDRYDSQYYLFIAQHGYPAHSAAVNTSLTAFFPGYSLLITVVHGLTFGTVSYLTCGIIVAWAAFIAASVLLYHLAERRYGQRVALIATILFCWFPSSLFFLSPYSEGLFALLIVLALFFLDRGRYLAAAMVAAYASATSPESIALTVAIVVAAVLAGKGVARVIAYVAVSGVGLGAYGLFLLVRFNNAFEFIDVQKKYWNRSEQFPFVGLYRNVQALEHYITGSGTARPNPIAPTFDNLKWVWILDDAALVVATVVLLGLTAMAVTRWRARGAHTLTLPSESAPIPWSYVIVGAVIVLIAACTTISPYALPQYASSEGEARFVSIAMPLYIGGALLIRRWASLIAIAAGSFVVLALLFQALYNLGFWVT